jgi:hypothetical protein
MLVYGHRTVSLNVSAFLRQFDSRLARLPAAPDHDAVIDLLVDWGEAESAVADFFLPERDDEVEELATWRTISDAVAEAACASWEQDAAARAEALARARTPLARLLTTTAAGDVRSKSAEGFSHYGLYPEQYMEAARRFARECRPAAVLCVGLRSVGSILAHVVAATLRRHGVPAATRSVRPRGHPFDRRLELTERLRTLLSDVGPRHVAVVDEGPGLSGSSFAAATNLFVAAGVRPERIVMFPSWQPAADNLRSPAARDAWTRHLSVAATFEDVCLVNGRLFGTTLVTADLSGGQWRERCFASADEWPAVQPQHERRKYLIGGGDAIRRFAGLGRRGAAIHDRAATLAGAGFVPDAVALTHGFLEQRWIPATPLTTATAASRPVLDRFAEYLAFVRWRFATGDADSVDEIHEMATVNASEGVGPWTTAPIDGLAADAREFSEPRVAVDGRMLPHEWIASGDRLVKTDALDHHDDDFWPGCRDIAWDVAGASVECELGPDASRYLVAAYERKSGDRTIAERLPFYETAYLAYRLAYTTLAAETLGESADGRAFTRLRQRYRRSLDGRLAHARPASRR